MASKTSGLLKAIQELGRIHDEMTLRYAEILVFIGLNPGSTIQDIVEKLAIPQSSASRAMISFRTEGRGNSRQTGFKPLVESVSSDSDLRIKKFYLTAVGQDILKSAVEALGISEDE